MACIYVETNRLHRHSKTYRTVTVRESFRADGKVRHRTLANITDLPALIVGRIVFQGSKLALTGVYLDSALWELCGPPRRWTSGSDPAG